MARLSDRVVTGAPNGILSNDEPIQWYAADGVTLIDGIKVDATGAVYLAPAGGPTKAGGDLDVTGNTTSTYFHATSTAVVATDGNGYLVRSPSNGANVYGFGTNYDSALSNRNGSVGIGVVANTQNVEVKGNLSNSGTFISSGGTALATAATLNTPDSALCPTLTITRNGGGTSTNDLYRGANSGGTVFSVDAHGGINGWYLNASGEITVTGGGTVALSGEGKYAATATYGAQILGRGSSYDVTLSSYQGAVALYVPTNTQNVGVNGKLSVGADLVFASVSSQDIYQANSGLNLQISGGTSASLGANTVLYGNGHGSAGQHLWRSDTTTRMILSPAGALSTSTGALGTISERRFKTEIVEAKSQVDDIQILASRMKNFVKDNDGLKQLGWIVDEIEADFPRLIYTEDCIGEDGEPDGTTRKGITIGAIQIKAVKALGEALDRIDALEATNGELMSRLDALEALANPS